MTGPIDRLRDSDPAAALGPQPDERAEADLRLLLAEPQAAGAPVPGPERRRLAPILVTAVVAIAVIALTASVLAFVHPRVDAGGTITPTLGTSDCHPAQLQPFACGTYRSVYGAKSITGDQGGPAKDPLEVSFRRVESVLTMRVAGRCLSASVPVSDTAVVETGALKLQNPHTFTLKPIGLVRFGAHDCSEADTKHWAYTWLQRTHEVDVGGGLVVDSRTAMVTFEYQGAAAIGEKQLPRNDRSCVREHVLPFSCSTYRSVSGTGTVGFLGTNSFTLTFDHLNGELTIGLEGRCNGLSRTLRVDGSTVLAIDGAMTAVGCSRERGAQDAAVLDFFSGVLRYRVDGAQITFSSGSSTAVFSSRIGACLPTPATSPFCGSFTAKDGSGTLGFLRSSSYRLTFGQSGKQMTARVQALCSITIYAVTVDRSTVHLRAGSVVETNPCPAGASAHDEAMAKFLTSPLVYRSDGSTLSLDLAASGPFSSATFTRGSVAR